MLKMFKVMLKKDLLRRFMNISIDSKLEYALRICFPWFNIFTTRPFLLLKSSFTQYAVSPSTTQDQKCYLVSTDCIISTFSTFCTSFQKFIYSEIIFERFAQIQHIYVISISSFSRSYFCCWLCSFNAMITSFVSVDKRVFDKESHQNRISCCGLFFLHKDRFSFINLHMRCPWHPCLKMMWSHG